MPVDQVDAVSARRPTAALVLILVASFVVVLDVGIVNIALASIERELHAGAAAVQWVITAYAITFGGLLILGGRIGDLFGRRRMFVAGLLLFSTASLAGGFATSVAVLVAARAVQGVGAAVVAPAALSLITTSFSEGPGRTRALAFYGATAAVGFVAGLVLGGVLVQYFDWRAVLWVNVPIGLVAAGLAPVLLAEAPPDASQVRLDVGGAVLVTAGTAALVYAVSQGPVGGWSGLPTVGGFAAAAAFLAAFVAVERHHPSPLVRLGILRLRTLRTANAVTVLLGAWTAGELLVLPLYLQLVLHYSPLATGLAMVPQGVFGFVGVSRGAQLSRRIGLGRYIVSSVVASTVGLAILGGFTGAGTYLPLALGFGLTGLGNATCSFATTVAATQGVADDEQGLASALINMSRQLGAAVGVAAVAAIIGTGTSSGSAVAPDRAAMLVTAALAAGAIVVARGIGRGQRGEDGGWGTRRRRGPVHWGAADGEPRPAAAVAPRLRR